MKDAATMFMMFVAFGLLFFTWRMLKNAMRELLRIYLLGLRDKWRRHYVVNGLDMGDGAYAKMREILNNMVECSRSMSFIGLLYFNAKCDDETSRKISEERDAAFSVCDADTSRLATSIRKTASVAMLSYVAITSLGFLSLLIMLPLIVLCRIFTRTTALAFHRAFTVKPEFVESAVCGRLCS